MGAPLGRSDAALSPSEHLGFCVSVFLRAGKATDGRTPLGPFPTSAPFFLSALLERAHFLQLLGKKVKREERKKKKKICTCSMVSGSRSYLKQPILTKHPEKGSFNPPGPCPACRSPPPALLLQKDAKCSEKKRRKGFSTKRCRFESAPGDVKANRARSSLGLCCHKGKSHYKKRENSPANLENNKNLPLISLYCHSDKCPAGRGEGHPWRTPRGRGAEPPAP